MNRSAVPPMIIRVVAATSRGGREAEQGGSFRGAGPGFCRPQATGAAPQQRLLVKEEAMFTIRTLAVAAVLLGVAVSAYPVPAQAQEEEEEAMQAKPNPVANVATPGPAGAPGGGPPDVDKAMGIFVRDKPAEFKPIGPGGGEVGMEKSDDDDELPASKGIVMGIKPGVGEVGMEFCCNPDDERSAKGIVMGIKPGGLSAAKGITPTVDFGGAAGKGIAAKRPPTVLPAGKGPPTVLPTGKALQGLKGLPVGQKMEVIPK